MASLVTLGAVLWLFFQPSTAKRPDFLLERLQPKLPWEVDNPTFEYTDDWDLDRIEQGHRLDVDIVNEIAETGSRQGVEHSEMRRLKNNVAALDTTNLTRPRWLVQGSTLQRRKRDLFKHISRRKGTSESSQVSHHGKGHKRRPVKRDAGEEKGPTIPTIPTIPPPFTYPPAPSPHTVPSFMQLLAMENHFDFALFAQAGVADTLPWEEPELLSNCWLQKMLAEMYAFSPSCKPDGSFVNKQCFLQRCWCVDDRGHPRLQDHTERFSYRSSALLLHCGPDVLDAEGKEQPAQEGEVDIEFGRVEEEEGREDQVARKLLKPEKAPFLRRPV